MNTYSNYDYQECMSIIESNSEYSNLIAFYKTRINMKIRDVLTDKDYELIKQTKTSHNARAKILNCAIEVWEDCAFKNDVIAFCIAKAMGTKVNELCLDANELLPERMCFNAYDIFHCRRKDINDSPMRDYSIGKQSFRTPFKNDIQYSVRLRNIDEQVDLEMLCVMYACDMCLEFKEKSDGNLPLDWIKHIAAETCDVFEELYSFEKDAWERCFNFCGILMQMPLKAKLMVDKYYGRIS